MGRVQHAIAGLKTEWRAALTGGQQRSMGLSPVSAKKPSSSSPSELGSAFLPAWLTPWFQPCDSLSRDPALSHWTYGARTVDSRTSWVCRTASGVLSCQVCGDAWCSKRKPAHAPEALSSLFLSSGRGSLFPVWRGNQRARGQPGQPYFFRTFSLQPLPLTSFKARMWFSVCLFFDRYLTSFLKFLLVYRWFTVLR